MSAAPPAAPLEESDVQLLAWAVVNCHVLARRALARTTSVYDREKWEHVLRICEKAGARSHGVLRASVPTEMTEGGAPARFWGTDPDRIEMGPEWQPEIRAAVSGSEDK